MSSAQVPLRLIDIMLIFRGVESGIHASLRSRRNRLKHVETFKRGCCLLTGRVAPRLSRGRKERAKPRRLNMIEHALVYRSNTYLYLLELVRSNDNITQAYCP